MSGMLTTFGVTFAIVAVLGGAILLLRRWRGSRTLWFSAVGMATPALMFIAQFMEQVDLREYMEPKTALAIQFAMAAVFGLLRLDTRGPVGQRDDD